MLNFFKTHFEKPILQRFVVVTSGLLLVVLSTSVEALQITRGPYLQSGTTSSVIVRWRTDINSNGIVNYGTDPALLNHTAEQVTLNKNHQVLISGLLPDTKYFYSVGSDSETIAGGDSEHFFTTSPEVGTTKSFRIWAVGDSGTANSSARNVRDAYLNFTGTRGTDLMLMLGDNAYDDGTDSEYQRAVFNMYPEVLRNTVLWSTLGNHDGHTANSSNQSGPYYDTFSFPRNGEAGGIPSGTEAYYSFDYGNIHFIVLDSYETNRGSSGAMMTWLTEDAAATDKDWLVAVWHHPPYSKGSHNSDSESRLIEMRQNALPILEANGVDLVLSGHSHSYERSFLIDGHYDKSGTFNNTMLVDGGDGIESSDGAYQKEGGLMPNEGAVYIVAGSSGKTSSASLNHPVMHVSMARLGSVIMDVEGTRMDVRFLDSNGNTRDNFTLLKGEAANRPPVANAGTDQTVDEDVTVTLAGSGSDPDGTIAAYQWSLVSGPAVVLTTPTAATAGFTAPDVAVDTAFTFNLEVTDNLGLTANDQVTITVRDSATTGDGADLLVSVLTPGTQSMLAGSELGYNVTVLNQGNQSAGSRSSLRLVLSTDSVIDGSDLRLKTRSVPDLASGSSRTRSGTVLIPANMAPGTYYLGAIADVSNTVVESDESNNTRSVAIVISEVVSGNADLVVSELVAGAQSVLASSELGYNVTVLNQGDQPAGSRSSLRLVLSTDSVITDNDRRLKTRSVPDLASGSSRPRSGTVLIPANLDPGTYYLGAIADVNDDVAESNETNNTRSVTIIINP